MSNKLKCASFLWALSLTFMPPSYGQSSTQASDDNPAADSSQEAAETKDADKQEAKPKQQSNKVVKPKASSPKTKNHPDVFNPSEEISEDFAVSFPVDI